MEGLFHIFVTESFFYFRVCHIKETIIFLFYIYVNSKSWVVYFINLSHIFFIWSCLLNQGTYLFFLILKTWIKNCGRFICQYSFYCYVVSVRLRKLSIISDFITATVGLKTFLFILVNSYKMIAVYLTRFEISLLVHSLILWINTRIGADLGNFPWCFYMI